MQLRVTRGEGENGAKFQKPISETVSRNPTYHVVYSLGFQALWDDIGFDYKKIGDLGSGYGLWSKELRSWVGSVTHTIGIHHKDVLSVLAFRANRREKKKQQQQGMVGDDP